VKTGPSLLTTDAPRAPSGPYGSIPQVSQRLDSMPVTGSRVREQRQERGDDHDQADCVTEREGDGIVFNLAAPDQDPQPADQKSVKGQRNQRTMG